MEQEKSKQQFPTNIGKKKLYVIYIGKTLIYIMLKEPKELKKPRELEELMGPEELKELKELKKLKEPMELEELKQLKELRKPKELRELNEP